MSAPAAPPAPGAAPSAALLATMADALPWPLLLLRRDGTLLHGNRAGLAVLRAGLQLQRAANSQVLPASAAQRPEFITAFEAALQGQTRLLHWPGPPSPCNATLSALRTPAGAPVVLMLALSLPLGRGADLQAYASLHGLSDAETRVLARLARGESTTRAATALRVAPSTVRTQAASLRRKTGHASIADLLHDLACLPPLGAPGDGE